MLHRQNPLQTLKGRASLALGLPSARDSSILESLSLWTASPETNEYVACTTVTKDRYKLGVVQKHNSDKLIGITLRQGDRVVKEVDFIETDAAHDVRLDARIGVMFVL